MATADDVTAAFGLIHATLVALWKEYVHQHDYTKLADAPSEAVLVLNDLKPALDEVLKSFSALGEVHKVINWLGREIAEEETEF